MDRIDLELGHGASVTQLITAADIVHDVALAVLEDDPYPTYAWMRRHRPIAPGRTTGLGFGGSAWTKPRFRQRNILRRTTTKTVFFILHP
jgi:hypothetical protein